MSYIFDPDNWAWLGDPSNIRLLLEGFLVNISIALIAMALSLVVGLFLALGRLSKNRVLSAAASVWIDVWRNLPLIFVILYLFIVMPQALKDAYSDATGGILPEVLANPQVLTAIVALTLYNSAVIAEIMRAGIVSLERGQGEAAAALGLPYWRAMRLIILPQGLRRMVPATVSQLITLTKDTSLISIISVQDLVRKARILSNTAGNPFFDPEGAPASILHVMIVVAIIFIAFNLMLSRLSRRLEIRERARTGTEVAPVTGLEDQVALAAESEQFSR
jgi:His/Glu/Gln/Arg/opine family amino acid ABC transporter permease subunit